MKNKLNFEQISKLIIPYLSIILIYLLATYKTLFFYFWHDDFSTLYSSRVGQCIYNWPYSTFCPIFNFLNEVLGYHSFSYFLLGNILGLLNLIAFFLICKYFFEKKIALILTLIFSTSFIAAGVFLEAWDPIVSFPTLSLLLLSILLFIKATKKFLKVKILLLSLFLFGLSVLIFPPRTSTNFIGYISSIFLFSKSLNLVKKVYLSIAALIIFLVCFYFIPMQINSILPDNTSFSINFLQSIDYIQRYKNFIQTIGSLIITDTLPSIYPITSKLNLDLYRLIIGLSLTLFFFIRFFIERHNKQVTNLRVFALIWIIFFYFPYLVRSSWRIESYHRYLFFVYPGILFAWGSFAKYKFWSFLSIFLIFFYLGQSYYFYNTHLTESNKRSSFYRQLHKEVVFIPEGTTIFLKILPSEKLLAEDYFRVGLTPSESALGTEYQLDYRKFEFISEDDVFSRKLATKQSNISKLFTFYYNGNKLFNTTNSSRKFLQTDIYLSKSVNELDKTNFILNSNSNTWTGKFSEKSFKFDNYNLFIPTKIELDLSGKVLNFPVPYSQDCFNCDYTSADYQKILNYLSSASNIITSASISASESGENTSENNLLDNNLNNYWIYNRQLWFKNKKPIININWKNPTRLAGLVIYSISKNHIPENISLQINGKVIPFNIEKNNQGVKLLFPEISVEDLVINILGTDGKDTPLINELSFVPFNLGTTSNSNIQEIQTNPAGIVESDSDKSALNEYISKGANACLKWKSKTFGEGKINFYLIADDTIRKYYLILPTLNLQDTIFTISCINYPLDLFISKVAILKP